jgi:ankyrin repeat protein
MLGFALIGALGFRSSGTAMICRFALLPIAAAFAFITAAPAALMAQTPPSERELKIYAGLHAAAATGDVAAIEQLVADGEMPNVQDSRSRTPLMVAAFRRQQAAAQALLRLGANPNARDADGYDILAIAAINNDAEMLKTALAAGANARAVTGRDGGSALLTAAQLGFVDIVRALIEAKADIDHVNGRGWTALITAVVLGNGSKQHIDIVEALVAARADADVKDRQGKNAIDYARARGYSDMVRILEKAVGRHT